MGTLDDLKQLKEQVGELAKKRMANDGKPFDIETMMDDLKPYADVQTYIDRQIRKLESHTIPKRSELK